MKETTTPVVEKTFRKSGRSTTVVMVGTFLSRIMGYVRTFVFAYVFGTTGMADVINAVFRIPESLRTLFAEGALSSAFIPTLSTAFVEDPSGERSRRIVRNLIGFILVVLIPLCTLGVVFNQQIVNAIIHFQDTKLYLTVSADGKRLAAAADDGAFHVSSDAGDSWTDRRSGHQWIAFAGSGGDGVLWGAAQDGLLYRSADRGITWSAIRPPGRRAWTTLAMSEDGRVVAAGTAGDLLFVSRDHGATWAGQTRLGQRIWTATAVSRRGTLVLAGDDSGRLLASKDGGSSVDEYPSQGELIWHALALADDESMVWGAAGNGFLHVSADGGRTWRRIDGAGKRGWISVACSADGKRVLAAVSEGTFYASSDCGNTWEKKEGAGRYRWKMNLAEELFPYVIWFLLFISLSAIFMGALNSKHIFAIPAITPILFSVTVIASLLWLPVRIEYRMIIGIVSGGLAQVLFQLPSLLRARYSIRPDFRFNHSDFKRVLVQWLPVVLSASIFAINTIVAVAFASGLEPGSVSALQYAVIFFQLPLGIFANSVITVLFPRMSRQAALKDTEALKETLRYGLRFMLLLLVPSTLLLVFLGEDVIGLTLQHGQFTRAGTLQTNPVLTAFALGLFSTGALNLFQRLHYSLKDYRRPVITAAFILVVDVGLSLILKETPLRVAGLALANTISFTAGLILFTLMTRKRLGLLGLRKLVSSGWPVLAGNIPLAGVITVYLLVLQPAVLHTPFLVRLILLAGTTLAGFGVTIGMYMVLKIDIIKDIFKERFRKKA